AMVQRARSGAAAPAAEQAEQTGHAGQAEEQRSPVHDVVSSGGSPLDTDTRTDMESRMGADFSDVRVHHDSAAHESAKGVGAHAYTVGNNVVFQRDAYDPGSPQGRTTLAHELTHVIQQRNGPVEGTEAPGGIRVSDPSDRFEREAVANADRVLSDPAPVSAPAPTTASAASAVQRTATEDEDEQPADVQGSFVQRAAEKKPREEEEEETPPA
ncbi:eCIS core domain-containing protein, partial [Streptomyces sp. wa1071]